MGNHNIIWRIVLLSLLCYSMLSFASVRRDVYRTEIIALELEQGLERLREESSELQLRLEQGYDDSQLQILARQRLGLVMPGEIIFYFN